MSVNAIDTLESCLIPVAALVAAGLLFAGVLALIGVNPADAFRLIYLGGFGTAFSWQATLSRSSPLLLTALCMAFPAQMGLAVIGGEGAFVTAGLVAAGVGVCCAGWSGAFVIAAMWASGAAAGAVVMVVPGLLRRLRGVNETISSLLINYILIAVFHQLVTGPLRDPTDVNRPSTYPIPGAAAIGSIPGTSVHWGFVTGVVACLLGAILVDRTTFGFGARVLGGNERAARMVGLSPLRTTMALCALGGAAAGLAGAIQIGAVENRASDSLIVGLGYTGILISFIARHRPAAIIPVAILFGGIEASSPLLQFRLGLPHAAILLLQGIMFVCVLVAQTLRGRLIKVET